MTSYIRGANPIWYMVDQIGRPLNDQYYAFFLTNTLPYLPQNVYQDPNGMIPWSNPIQFYANGTLPDNLYFDDTLVYRIEIRKGPTQADPLIGNPIQNYSPGNAESTPSSTLLLTAPSLVTNPQFADISFTSPFVYTQGSSSTYTLSIAPGWNLVLTGAGTTTITQTANPGDSDISTNPPYYLTIANSGWTTATLQQTFSNNGAIFSGGAIAISFLAFATGASQTLTVNYVDSGGSTVNLFPTTSILTGSLAFYSNAVTMPDSMNATTGTNAFVNINFVLPPSGTLTLTNIQLTGQSVPLPTNFDSGSIPPFNELTYERIVDQEFHVYKNSILIQPKSSLLVGWNFSLNPFQFITTTVSTVTAQTSYICDQTIMYQKAGSQLQTGSSTSNLDKFALQINPVVSATQTQFALIQYIDPSTILPYWNYNLSALVRIRLNSAHSTSVRFKMRLIASSALPATISNTEPIASWASTDPTFSVNWSSIAPENDPIYTLTPSVAGIFLEVPFNRFPLPGNASLGETQTLGVVIYTLDNMNSTSAVDYIIVDKVSLVPNDFALEAVPQTFDEVLGQCQFYYETSYDVGVVPGTNSGASILTFPQGIYTSGSHATLYPTNFGFQFNTVKRANPIMNVYALDGTAGSVRATFFINGVPSTAANAVIGTFWTQLSATNKSVNYIGATASPLFGPTSTTDIANYGYITLHFTANSCLGNPTLP